MFCDVQRIDRPVRLQQAQEMKRAIERAKIVDAGDHGDAMTAKARRSDDVSLLTTGPELRVEPEVGNHCRRRRRANDEGAISGDVANGRNRRVEQAGQATTELV